jgi:DNA-binding response OmpR family regulator
MVKKEEKNISKKILVAIVDDHVQTAVQISQILEFNGFRTFQAYNIEEAIKKIKSENPDLAVIEVMLNGEVSGIGLAKLFPKLKVIFLTGFELKQSDLRGVKNLVGIVKKPVSTEDVLNLARKEFGIKVPKKF